MSLDVGIVSYRCFDELGRCLESLYAQEQPLEGRVMVFENGPDDFPRVLKKRFPRVEFYKNHENLGFAKACNQIISLSSSPYICFLNPDTCVKAPFLKKAEKYLAQNEQVAVVGPKIVEPDGKVQGSARGFPSLSTAFFGRTSLISRFFPNNPLTKRNLKTLSSVSGAKEVDWVSGACMIVRRRAIEDVGGLDEGFFMYWEDCDWCKRFWHKGWKVVYHPGLGPIEHKAGASSKSARLMSLYLFHKSAVRLYLKYDKTPFRIGSLAAVAGGSLRFLLLFPRVLVGSFSKTGGESP